MTNLAQGSEMVLDSAVADASPTLQLHGHVGAHATRPHFTAASVTADLHKLRGLGPVAVSLNSTGGSAVEGVAISAALNAHPDGVVVTVEGVALSAAANIACAAPRSAISPGSTIMLHRSAIRGKTSASASPENRVRLAAFDTAKAEMLARKSGKPLAEVQAMLAAETWLTAEQAVEAGFIDRVVGQERGAPVADIADDEPLDPAELAELCSAAEQPQLTADLIRAKATLPQARARLDVMATIRPMLAFVDRQPGITAALKAEALSGRLSVAQVRERIFDALADEDEKFAVDNKKPTASGAPDGRAKSKANMMKLVDQKFGPRASKIKETRK